MRLPVYADLEVAWEVSLLHVATDCLHLCVVCARIGVHRVDERAHRPDHEAVERTAEEHDHQAVQPLEI